ncbi:hypothetical protein LTS10_009261 [Elasticomyces elasticus]|nr:hypothetical protein LTS10_009261 [Elasticomyces elasticus]
MGATKRSSPGRKSDSPGHKSKKAAKTAMTENKKSSKRWSPEHVEYLLEKRLKQMPFREIATLIGRSELSCRLKVCNEKKRQEKEAAATESRMQANAAQAATHYNTQPVQPRQLLPKLETAPGLDMLAEAAAMNPDVARNADVAMNASNFWRVIMGRRVCERCHTDNCACVEAVRYQVVEASAESWGAH